MDKFDWTLTRSFLAVADHGSLSAAARVLGLSQPTLGRHIADMEAALGVVLFTRQPRGLLLTDAAAELLPHARTMAEAAARLSLAAAAQDDRVKGTVRITASRVVAQFLLPPLIARMRQDHPGIAIELVPSDSSENLLFREADIALRMYRPTQDSIVTRHVGDLPLGLYATPALLAQTGRPQSMDDLLEMPIVGFDRSDLMIRVMKGIGVVRRREDFPLRCDDQIVAWNLVRAGAGAGGMQRIVGDSDPLVERIAPFLALPALPLWLAAPEALRQVPRVRLVLDDLAEGLKPLATA